MRGVELGAVIRVVVLMDKGKDYEENKTNQYQSTFCAVNELEMCMLNFPNFFIHSCFADTECNVQDVSFMVDLCSFFSIPNYAFTHPNAVYY